jgi:hypothetical protein
MIQNVFQGICLPAEHEVFDEYIAPRRWLILFLLLSSTTFYDSIFCYRRERKWQ